MGIAFVRIAPDLYVNLGNISGVQLAYNRDKKEYKWLFLIDSKGNYLESRCFDSEEAALRWFDRTVGNLVRVIE